MCDKLVFDLAQEVEGSPNVFIRKDWLNILDNQNQNYNSNQSIVDTSQLSNSNKYMSYRESYFSIPFLITLQQTGILSNNATGPTTTTAFAPAINATSADNAIGLKNWFGQIIHSFTLDYNGTTICQQTPYINMWNSFKLMTSLSLDDINTQGATIGFYPDDATSWTFTIPSTGPTGIPANPTTSNCLAGAGVCNNTNLVVPALVSKFNNFDSGKGNDGFIKRQNLINFDVNGIIGNSVTGTTVVNATYNSLLSKPDDTQPTVFSGDSTVCQSLWKSYISKKVDSVRTSTTNTLTTKGYIQYSIVATVYLKHVHSFFNMCPLLKGVFLKMTMNLNNTSSSLEATSYLATTVKPAQLLCTSVTNALGGVNPLMVASATDNDLGQNGGISLFTPWG